MARAWSLPAVCPATESRRETSCWWPAALWWSMEWSNRAARPARATEGSAANSWGKVTAAIFRYAVQSSAFVAGPEVVAT